MPLHLDPGALAVAAFAFFLAGFVKGVVGLGLPPVAMGLLSLIMAPSQAAALLVVPAFVTNVWQLAAGPRFAPLACRLWPMLAASVVATLAVAALLHGQFGEGPSSPWVSRSSRRPSSASPHPASGYRQERNAGSRLWPVPRLVW